MSEKGKITRGRLGSLSLRKEGERQCFLFSKHLIICTRGSGGKLHLTKVGARHRGQRPVLAAVTGGVSGASTPSRGRSPRWALGGRIPSTWPGVRQRCVSSEPCAKTRDCQLSVKEGALPCSRSPDNLFSEKLKLQPRFVRSARSLLRSLPKTQAFVGGSFAVN